MNGRRETGLWLSVSEVFNVGCFEQWGYPSLLECTGEGACDVIKIKIMIKLR